MDTFDVMVVCILLILFLWVGGSIYSQNEVCGEFGGEMNGQLDCMKDGKFYEIYSSSFINPFEHKVNTLPKTERWNS